MKLAYLSDSKIPSREANAVHVVKMCQAFARLGHDVVLVTPDIEPENDLKDVDPFEFYGLEKSFSIVRPRKPSIKGGGWIYGWRAGRMVRTLRADAAVGRSLQACAVSAYSGTPTVWDTHMPTFLRFPQTRWLFRRMTAASGFRGVTTNTEALRAIVVAAIPSVRTRTLALHNGADAPEGGLEPARLADNGRFRVGYIGQLYLGKGLELIGQIAPLASWADFYVVGGSNAAVSDAAKVLAGASNVKLLGFVPHSEVGTYAAACDVLVAPYQRTVQIVGGGDTAGWMSPIKIFEYMAAGKPILSSNLPVIREVLKDGHNSMLLPPDDPQQWAEALVRLRDDPDERRRLGEAARNDFDARHTWLKRAEGMLTLLSGQYAS